MFDKYTVWVAVALALFCFAAIFYIIILMGIIALGIFLFINAPYALFLIPVLGAMIGFTVPFVLNAVSWCAAQADA